MTRIHLGFDLGVNTDFIFLTLSSLCPSSAFPGSSGATRTGGDASAQPGHFGMCCCFLWELSAPGMGVPEWAQGYP